MALSMRFFSLLLASSVIIPSPAVNYSIFDSGHRDKKINVLDPAHTASQKEDICSNLLKQLKLDLHLSDSEEKSGPDSPTSLSSSAKEKRKSRRKKEEKTTKMQQQKNPANEDDTKWVKAKGKVEEFLDFPGVFSAMAFRSQMNANRSSQVTPAVSSEQVSRSEPNAIPNTRHNAIFLRENEKAAQGLQLNPLNHDDK